MAITPKCQTEFKFINDLLKKLGILSATNGGITLNSLVNIIPNE